MCVYICMCGVCVHVCVHVCVRVHVCVLVYECGCVRSWCPIYLLFTFHQCVSAQVPTVLPVWRIAIYVGCCVAGVLVMLAFVINFCLW